MAILHVIVPVILAGLPPSRVFEILQRRIDQLNEKDYNEIMTGFKVGVSCSWLSVSQCQALKCVWAAHDLSLYSTATPTPSRWGLALGNTPNASISSYLYQHVGI